MRDALSLLDKIVSFTGGQVNYPNTIEHLNLLDEDQYFKMLDALVNQDIAGALLQYDAIHARGFEGDTVLNGFAGMMRNLLVSRDGRAAQLLDVLEGMQGRYAETAAGLSLSYMVSAIQVITDAEMTIKSARNKRLHVELALIKLCYLQQVIDMAVTAEGKVVKKKRIDGPVALKEKPVSPLLLKITQPQDASLKIDQPPIEKVQPVQVKEPVAIPQPRPVENKSVAIETAKPAASVSTTPVGGSSGKKMDLLSAIKAEKMLSSGKPEEVKAILPPEKEGVREIWDNYIEKLKVAQRHSILTSFQIAMLEINGNEVVVNNPSKINLRVIESEASELLTLFKQRFNNPEITLRLEVSENEDDNQKTVEPKYLNSQQRFQLMATDYPAVLELKEKLKLDLGY